MSADVLTEHSPYPDSLRNREWNEDVGEGLCLNPWESSDFTAGGSSVGKTSVARLVTIPIIWWGRSGCRRPTEPCPSLRLCCLRLRISILAR